MLYAFAAIVLSSAPPVDRYFHDPHPMRTLFRGPVLRLLDDPQTRLTLELDSTQSAKLVEFLRELDRKQDEFFAKTEEDLHLRFDSLKSGYEARQRSSISDFEKAVGVKAKRRLIGRALHFWGDLAPFAVGAAEELGVTRAQRSAAEDVVRRFERKRVEVSGEKEMQPKDLEMVAQALGQELAKLITAAQRRKLDELAGPKPDWAPELYVDREAAREERENRPPLQRIHRDPRRLLNLVQIDEVLEELKIRGEERRSTLQWAKAQAVEEEALAILKRTDVDTMQVRSAKLADFDERFDEALSKRLDARKMERARQIRWQLAGAGAVFSDVLRKELGVSNAQFQTAIAKLQADADERAAADAKIADENELRKRQAKREREFQDLLLGSLTEDQRKKWRQLLGEPIDKNTLSRISRRL